MFYTGWKCTTPSSMNIGALASELRPTVGSPNGGTATAPIVSQQLLSNLPLHSPATTRRPSTSEAAITTSTTPPAPAAAPKAAPHLPSKADHHHHRVPRHRSASPRGGFGARGCVLHLAPRQALSYKEIEQQLQRRASGASDCFHVKSDIPITAQSGVLLMECVVGPAAPAAETTDAADSKSARGDASASDAAAAAKPGATAGHAPPARRPVPPLVVGVCQRHLPWHSLPGEANNSIGFYVTQRHVMKHGGDDQDEVIVPAEGCVGANNRISEGDYVGCLVDLMQHTLCFTVNQRIVSTQSMDPNYEDGSLYFAIGLTRRPQHATDVTVRFYSGSASLVTTALSSVPSAPSEAGTPDNVTTTNAAAHCQPCFPLAQYTRSLAIDSVCHRSPNGASGARSGAGRRVDDLMTALKGAEVSGTAERRSASPSSLPPSFAPGYVLTSEAARDLRISAVLRDYLALRGMSTTLSTLDKEMRSLAPSHAHLCSSASLRTNSAAGVTGEGNKQADETTKPARLRKHSPSLPHAWSPSRQPTRHSALLRRPLPDETRAAWQTYADEMAQLRRALLLCPLQDSDGSCASVTDSQTPSQLLLTHALWKPSLVLALAQCVEEAEAGAPVATAEAEPHANICVTGKAEHQRHRQAKHHPAQGGDKTEQFIKETGAKTAAVPSPYVWFNATVSPAYLAFCLLAVRQDVRYLLHAHHLVEEMWCLLRAHLRKAREGCTAAAAAGSQMPSSLLTFAPSMEDERREVAAFTTFFGDVLWSGDHVLPSAIPHMRPSRKEKETRRAAAEDSEEGRSQQADPPPMHVKALQALAALAGHTRTPLDHPASRLPRSSETQKSSHRERSDGGSERQRFYCLLASYRSSTAADAAAHPPLSATASMEEALLVLYRCSVVPAAAPSRASQVRLLQTLCSLFAHACSTLRQLEGLVHVDEAATREDDADGLVRVAQRGDGACAAVAAVDLLETLLEAVRRRLRQLVWRRLVHAIEDANQQLEMRLRAWQATAIAISSGLRKNEGVVAPTETATRPSRESMGTSVIQKRRDASNADDNSDSEHGGNEEEEEEEEEEIGLVLPDASESLTASFSSFQTPETTESDEEMAREGNSRRPNQRGNANNNRVDLYSEEHKEEDEEAAAVHHHHHHHHHHQNNTAAPSPTSLSFTPSPHTADAVYESMTDALPSLRLLWRRVCARAALEPSRHLVTSLFVEELRTSLRRAPPSGQHPEGVHHDTARDTGAPAAAAAAVRTSMTDSAPVSVKRPQMATSPCTSLSNTTGAPSCDGGAVADDTEAVLEAAQITTDTRWFTEELYWSSVYMKRVLKHLSGH